MTPAIVFILLLQVAPGIESYIDVFAKREICEQMIVEVKKEFAKTKQVLPGELVCHATPVRVR